MGDPTEPASLETDPQGKPSVEGAEATDDLPPPEFPEDVDPFYVEKEKEGA